MSAVQNTSDFGLEQDEECAFGQHVQMSATKRAEVNTYRYLAFLADMLPTLRKVDEMEPSTMSTYNITGFKISVDNSNTMKVFN
jgi:hypothetical protein